MARVRKVTRTIVSTDAEVKTINVDTNEIASVVVTVAGTFTDPKDETLIKTVKKSFANKNLGENIVMVAITDVTQVTKHYTMLEDTFISLAECKVLSQGEAPEDDEDEE